MPQAKALSDSDLKRILAVIDAGRHSERNRIAFMLSYLAGMRCGEIASLRIQSVVDRQGNIRDEIRLTPEMTKGQKGRSVVVSNRLQRELKRYLKSLDVALPQLPLIPSQKRSRAFSANSLVQVFGRIYREAGIDGASSHSGRRTFITQLAAKGVSARVLQKLAGHASLATTQRYIDVNDEMLRQAVELI